MNKWCQTQHTSPCTHYRVLLFREFNWMIPQLLSVYSIKVSILGDNPPGDNSPGRQPPTENTPGDTPRPDPSRLTTWGSDPNPKPNLPTRQRIIWKLALTDIPYPKTNYSTQMSGDYLRGVFSVGGGRLYARFSVTLLAKEVTNKAEPRTRAPVCKFRLLINMVT